MSNIDPPLEADKILGLRNFKCLSLWQVRHSRIRELDLLRFRGSLSEMFCLLTGIRMNFDFDSKLTVNKHYQQQG